MSPKLFQKNNGYEIDGLWYPRVTSICNIIAKPGLEIWLANQPSFIAMQRKRKKITGWGILIHETIEKILLKKNPEIKPNIRPSIQAFLDWLSINKVKPLSIEKRVFSKQNTYAGTFDVLAEINGKLGIVDLKTSRDIWDDHFIQTAAYFNAYNEKTKKKAKTHWILKIDQYQKCKICGAEKRNKLGDISIKRGKRFCRHDFNSFIGSCQLKKVDNHRSFLNMFLAAKRLWELSNRQQLSQIKNYPNMTKTHLTLF
ncbi:MAG: hypothetical protein ACKKMW_02730 [Candidatus Nealsonbacteria bacterium]